MQFKLRRIKPPIDPGNIGEDTALGNKLFFGGFDHCLIDFTLG